MFDLKRVISGAAIAVILPSMAVAMSSNAQGANAQNRGGPLARQPSYRLRLQQKFKPGPRFRPIIWVPGQ